MSEGNSVLAIIEPDISPEAIVERAAWLAGISESKLELLLCDADVSALGDRIYVSNEARDIAVRIREAQREMLDDLALPAKKRGLDVATGVLDQRPIADAVVHVALDRNPLFVVKGTQYHSDAERAILVDTDWQLVRTCPFPLWLVKPHRMPDRPLIIAAVDPMHSNDEAAKLDRSIIRCAQDIAGKTGGEMHLLHIYQPMSGIGAAATRTFKPIRLAVEEIGERMEKEHRRRLEELAAAAGVDAARTHQIPGNARDVLPYVARERNAGLVVMGAMARSALSRRIIGSTAEKVLDHLPCDVLILRAAED
jgi:universal stress protein E